MRAYIYWLVAGSLFALLGIFLSFQNVLGSEGAVLQSVVGYNALFTVAILTVTVILTTVLCLIGSSLRVVEFPIDFRAAMRLVATWIGNGTLTGFIAAALTPVTVALFKIILPSLTTIFAPVVLLQLPAIGAVCGYYVGLLGVVFTLGKEAEHLLYRFLLVPVIFIIFLVLFHRIGLTPDWLFQQLERASVSLPAATVGLSQNGELAQQAETLSRISREQRNSGASLMLSGDFVVIFHSVLVLGVAVYLFIKSAWSKTARAVYAISR